MDPTRRLCYHIAGASPQDAAELDSLIASLQPRLSANWQSGSPLEADLLIVDTGSTWGHMDWLRATAEGRRAASWSPLADAGGGHWLRKPSTPAGVAALLNRVAGELGIPLPSPAQPDVMEAAGAEPDAEPAPAAAADETAGGPAAAAAAPAAPAAEGDAHAVEEAPAVAEAPSAEPDLLALLNGDGGTPLRLQAPGLPVLYLDPANAAWHADCGLKALSGWTQGPIPAAHREEIDEATLSREGRVLGTQPWSRLVWLVHLLRGGGRIAPTLEGASHFRLARWPQSEREFPKHFRIATMMLKDAASPAEIAAAAGASEAEVADFINAYHALGFIEAGPFETREASRRTGLFGVR